MDETLPGAVIVDIDGTLALRGDREGVRHWFDWARVGEDDPNHAVVELVQLIADAGRHRIIVVSGRKDVCRAETERWLDDNEIPFDELRMRRASDNRPDTQTKSEIYRTFIEPFFKVSFVIDDRNAVVRMWRDELGLACFQVAEGDF